MTVIGVLREIVWLAGLTVVVTTFTSEVGPVEEFRTVVADVRYGANDIVRGFLDPIFEDLIEALTRRP